MKKEDFEKLKKILQKSMNKMKDKKAKAKVAKKLELLSKLEKDNADS